MARCTAPGCPGFEIFPSEKFCPWCGAPKADFTLSVEVNDAKRGGWRECNGLVSESMIKSGLRAKLTYIGADSEYDCDLIRDIVCSEHWLSIAEIKSPKVVFNNKNKTVYVELKSSLSSLNSRLSNIILYATFHQKSTQKSSLAVTTQNCQYTLRIEGEVKLDCQRINAQGQPDKSPVARCADGSLIVPFGIVALCGDVRILSITPENSSDRIIFDDNCTLPQVVQDMTAASAAAPQPLRANYYIPPEYAARMIGNNTVSLKVVYETWFQGTSSHSEVTKKLKISVTGLPKVELDGEPDNIPHIWPVIIDSVASNSEQDQQYNTKEVTLSNAGDQFSPMILQAITCTNITSAVNDSGPLSNIPSLPPIFVTPAKSLPCEIAEMSSLKLSLRVNPQLGAAPQGKYTCGLKVDYLDATQKQHSVIFPYRLDLQETQTFNGTLAIDLGTSSSCAIIVKQLDTSPHLVPLDDYKLNTNPNCLTSVIQYNKYNSNTKDYVAGWLSGLTSQSHPYACIVSPKRFLGNPHPFDVTPQDETWHTVQINTTSAVEHLYDCVAQSIQTSIAKGALAQHGIQGKLQFQRLVLTHPSRFSLRQINLLLRAAERAFQKYLGDEEGQKVRIDHIPEPTAAAMCYLSKEETYNEWHKRRQSDDIAFTVLVYDCGGGTTDVSLLRVESKRERAQNADDKPEPQFIEDVVEYFGEKLPKYVDQAVEKRCKDTNAAVVAKYQNLCNSQNWLHYNWDQVNIPFPYDEFSQDIVSIAHDDWSNNWQYLVKLRLLGATGDPHFGGELMTDNIASLLIKKLMESLSAPKSQYVQYTLPLDPHAYPHLSPKYQELVRENAQILHFWAERAKCNVKRENNVWKMELPKNRQAVTSDNDPRINYNLTLFNTNSLIQKLENPNTTEVHLLDVLNGNTPTYEECIGELRREVLSTWMSCQSLIRECLGPDALPDVLLLTGQASRWPQISEELQRRLNAKQHDNAKVYFVHPQGDELKHCVVEGASRWSTMANNSGVVAGVAGVYLSIDGSFQSSSSRLGIIQSQAGQQLFIELIGAGRPFDADDCVRGQREYKFNQNGPVKWNIYENTSSTKIVEDNTTNLHLVCSFELDIPPQVVNKRTQITLTLNSNSQLQLIACCDDWKYESPLKNIELGQNY